MIKEITIDKGIEVYDVSELAKDVIDEMLNQGFEDNDATLKSNIKITINIEEQKQEDLK